MTSIKKVGTQEVNLFVLGLDFSLNKKVIYGYLERFGGKFMTRNMIWNRDKQGPFKGLLNSERKYMFDISDVGCDMWTYHYLGSNKLKILYKENSKTFGKYHRDQKACPGSMK